jgi:acyl carrier protein
VTRDEIRALLLDVLGEIAPEADLAGLDPGEDLREQLDIDSMDLLNFAIGVHERTGVEIPEIDYPKLTSLDSCTAYLDSRLRTEPS